MHNGKIKKKGEENRKGDNSPPKRVQKIMAKLDKDNDGSLSPEEFIEGCLNDEILRHLLAPNVGLTSHFYIYICNATLSSYKIFFGNLFEIKGRVMRWE